MRRRARAPSATSGAGTSIWRHPVHDVERHFLSTDRGVIVSQMHRSPGVFFHHAAAKATRPASSCSPRAYPYRGSGSTSSSTPRTSSCAHRSQAQAAATTLLYALAMDNEESFHILQAHRLQRDAARLAHTLRCERMRGRQGDAGIYDAAQARLSSRRQELNARTVRQLSEK